jgi:hypothetical protein
MYLWVGEEGGEGGWRRGGARERGIECITVLSGTVNTLSVPIQSIATQDL